MEWNPQRQKQLLAMILVGLAAAAWNALFFGPQWKEADRLGKENRTLKNQIVRARQDLAQRPQWEAQRQQLQQEARQWVSVIPSEQQLPALLGKVAKAAHAAHVKVSGLRPESGAKPAPPVGGFVEVPVEVLASAGYHSIGRFVDALESSGDLIRLKSVEIRESRDDIWNHQVRLVLQAYLMPASPES